MGYFGPAASALSPDLIFCLGVYHRGQGRPTDQSSFAGADQVIAVGSSEERFRNIPGLDMALLADEGKTLDRLLALAAARTKERDFDERRDWALRHAATIREQRLDGWAKVEPASNRVHPVALGNAINNALLERGGGQLMIEQYAVPVDCMDTVPEPGVIPSFRAGGASEGWGVGATIGTKLAAPDQPVVGLVGDGSLYFADSGIWSAAHHGIPILYVISNNEAYGVVAGAFGRAQASMKETGHYGGVVLAGPDPVKIAAGFGIDGIVVTDEASLDEAMAHGLSIVEKERRPYLLDVRLPLGVPEGGRAAKQFCLSETL
ncbi:MAG: thiamine pyrophosphate-dependent enzyme [Chloroflexota bacterium]